MSMSDCSSTEKYAGMDYNVLQVKLVDVTAANDLQPRAHIKSHVVDEYAEAMKRGEHFPPIVVFNDGTTNWLADGYHRYRAAKKAGLDQITAEFRRGSKNDALRFALSASATHGLRRSRTEEQAVDVFIVMQNYKYNGHMTILLRRLEQCGPLRSPSTLPQEARCPGSPREGDFFIYPIDKISTDFSCHLEAIKCNT